METYKISLHCSNCGYSSTQNVEKGTSIGEAKIGSCQICGCYTVRGGKYHEPVETVRFQDDKAKL